MAAMMPRWPPIANPPVRQGRHGLLYDRSMGLVDLLRSASQRFESSPRWLRVGTTLAVLAAILWLDYVTPAYISLSGFYLLPLFLAAWYCGALVTAGVAVVAVFGSTYFFVGSIAANTPFWHLALAFVSLGTVAVGFAFEAIVH